MPQITQRSFTSGEIAPALQSRADMTKYATGLHLCENFLVRAQGGVYSRPGFRFVGELDNSARVGRLIPFSFNTEQTYILVFEHLKVRVIKDGGFVLDGGGPAIFELATPYTESQLPRLGFTQNADVMTIVHPDHDPRNLNRMADDDWSLTTIDYAPTVDSPTFSSGSVDKAITGISQSNPAVVTAVAHGFVTGNLISINGVAGMTQVNGRSFIITALTTDTFELNGEDSTGHDPYTSGGTASRQNGATTIGEGFGDFDKTYTYVVTAVDAEGSESLASAEVSITTGSLATTAGVRLTWDTVPEAEYYRVYKDPSVGTGIYGWIGDSNNNSFDDYNIAPITSDAPPSDRQPFNGEGNKPSTVTYYQQRQVFANTYNEPQATFTTQTNNFDSLRVSNPARDDDAVTFTIAARQVNEIRHLLPLDSLILLTSGGEWIMTEGQDRVLTPATVGVRIQSYNGCSIIPPVVINSTALYLQEKGTRLRDLGYEFSSDKYTGNDLSLMSEHLFEGHTIVSMAYADEPYSIVWCVRDDGVLLGLTYQREHQVWGWHKHTTQGEFEYVATVTEGSRDAVYAIVKRTINGSVVRYVERLEPRESINAEDCFYLDSGLTYDGAPATVISGLDHLNGETVSILTDGYTVPDQVVSEGQITLQRAASKVHVGLSYLPAIETLDIDTPSPSQTLKAQSVSVSKVTIEVDGSRGGWVGPRQDNGSPAPMSEIKPRFDSDNYDPIALKTYKSEVFIQPQWGKGGGVRIEQRAPLPMSILSIIPQIDIGGN
ncbi:FCCH domain ubiquitin-activating enzyme E1 [Vibrio phage 1.185.O._10N.286.49.C2]|nr:FCCH domain ubiquitin-activating enzyme E1 [Vibrio phage 1.185.O._10N.286.49.C2]